ncbi:MAG: DNA-processing protein DprA [Bacteroidota bacterium]
MTAPFALALLSLDGVGRVTAHRVLERFTSAASLREAPHEQVLLRLKGTPNAERTVEALRGAPLADADERSRQRVEALTEKGIHVLAPGGPAWPSGLDALSRSDRPVVLYAFGDLKALRWPALAVLAAAPLDGGAFETAQSVAQRTLAQGRGLVVGAATGVDLALQKLSLAAGLPAVAVVGAGLARLDRSMRPGATTLTRSGGLLVSSFPMAHGPFDHDDRERALVQAALGRAVLAVTPPAGSPEAGAVAWAASAERPVALVPPAPADASWADAAHPTSDPDAIARLVA